MEIHEHIDSLRREGDLLATAAARTDPETPVPTCPGWRMRDLVRHTGGVHRWAAAHVRDRLVEGISVDQPEDMVDVLPDDAALVDWFREGHAHLVEVLERADPGLACFTFLEAPSPLAFWARRQAHETGIHRVDAESAAGVITPFPPAVAADGIDELLVAFLTRPRGRLRSAAPRTLGVHATDVARDWLVRIRPDRVEVSRDGVAAGGHDAGGRDAGGHDAGCAVRGSASDLFVLLWNRRAADGHGIDVQGDHALLDLWRESVRVRWS